MLASAHGGQRAATGMRALGNMRARAPIAVFAPNARITTTTQGVATAAEQPTTPTPTPLTPRRRRALLSRAPAASGDGGPSSTPPQTPPPTGPEEDQKRRFESMLAELRATGLDQQKARRLLKAWAKAGALDPEQLRALLVRRSLAPARALGVQGGIDLLAAGLGFYSGSGIAQAADFPGKIALEAVCYFGAMWYAISGAAGWAALAQALVASRRYASSADALLAAVQTLAGPEGVSAAAAEAKGRGGGVGALAANVALAVSTAKVVAALDGVARQLREMDAAGGAGAAASGASSDGPAPLQRSTLVNLAAYLTMQDASERAGFRPEDYGLTEKEATDIAGIFAMFDTNENYLLESSELRSMCGRLGRDLSDAEAREAARLMAGGDGGAAARGVTFPQFVAWWTGGGGGGGGKAAGA